MGRIRREGSEHGRARQRSLAARAVHIGQLFVVAAGAAIGGAVVEYFTDPDRGHARRARLRSEAIARARSIVLRRRRATARAIRHVLDPRVGAVRARYSHLKVRDRHPDDVTLAQKVRSEALGHLSSELRSRIVIDVVDAVVRIRGEVDTGGERHKIASSVARVHGVRRVENLLHGRGEDAPNKVAALRVDRAR